MLILSRKRDEEIFIGDDIKIMVVDIRGSEVHLGITAPSGVQVHRREIYDRIKREQEQGT